MKAYITSVAAAAIMAAFADNFVPIKWQKYISLLTGAILLLTLITPFLKLRKINIPKLDSAEYETYEYELTDRIHKEFKKNVEEDVKERLSDEFGITGYARARIALKDGKIQGVEKIDLSCKANEAVANRMKEVYGCDTVEFFGGVNDSK